MPSRLFNARTIIISLACGLSLGVAGCAQHKVHAAAPVVAPPSPAIDRPMTIAPDTDATPPVDAVATPPAMPPAAAAPPPVPIVPAKPPAPHRVGSATDQPESAEPEPASHPPAPQISPQLSARDQASYEHKTADDLGVAEQNLGQANGKQLSAAQQDLVEKIRSFISDSRAASKGGDWPRAQNLAQKARLLSVELLNSL